MDDRYFMSQALELAREAAAEGEQECFRTHRPRRNGKSLLPR